MKRLLACVLAMCGSVAWAESLDDPKPLQRLRALKQLEQDPRAAAYAIPKLMKMWEQETAPNIRAGVLSAMGAAGPEAKPALPLIVKSAQLKPPPQRGPSDGEANLRAAEEATGLKSDPRLDYWHYRKDERLAALTALPKLQNPQATKVALGVMRAAEKDYDRGGAEYYSTAIRAFGEARTDDPQVLKALDQALKSSDRRTDGAKLHAIIEESLRKLGRTESLTNGLSKDK